MSTSIGAATARAGASARPTISSKPPARSCCGRARTGPRLEPIEQRPSDRVSQLTRAVDARPAAGAASASRPRPRASMRPCEHVAPSARRSAARRRAARRAPAPPASCARPRRPSSCSPRISSSGRPSRQLDADVPVAAERARARQHQIAEARSARPASRAGRRARTASRDISASPRVMSAASALWPSPSAFDDAGGDRDDVLQRAADLDADDVVGCRRAGSTRRGTPPARARRRARRCDATTTAVGSRAPPRRRSSGPTARHIGTAPPSSSASTSDIRSSVAVLEALGGADDVAPGASAAPALRPPRAVRATARRRRPARRHRAPRPGRAVGRDRRRKRDVGQVDRVGAAPPHLADKRGIAGPQSHLMTDPRQVHRERRAPAAGAEHRHDPHGVTL